MDDNVINAVQPEKFPQKLTYWGAAWRRFKNNKVALISMYFVLILFLAAILVDVISPYKYDETHYEYSYESSSAKFIFGTDGNGRDMFSRVLYSLRNALIIAFGSQLMVLVVGVLLGSFAGFRGGIIDTLIMRLVDIMYAFPNFLFQLILITAFGKSLFVIMLAIGLTGWAGMARLVRGQVLSLRQAEYVEAAKALGARDSHIIAKYLIPNTLGTIIISFMMSIPQAMMAESALSVVGMGLNPPMPSFGNLIWEGSAQMLGFPHLALWPALVFAIILLSFNFFGDGLRDALNPKSEV